MKIAFTRTILAVFLVLVAGSGWAYAPLVILVGSTDVTIGGDLSAPPAPTISAGADLDWRVPTGKSGYAAVWGSARLEMMPLANFALTDRESIGFEIGGFPGGIGLTASSSVIASTGLLDSAAQVEPAWSVTGLIPVGQRTLSLGVEYSGTYRWRDADTIDRLENRMALRTVVEPSFTTGFEFDLTGGTDLFPKTYLLDPAGAPTAEQRRDQLILANFSLDHLSGYFTRWTASFSSGARISNANRYIPASDEIEAASENRIFGSVAANLALSPSRKLGINFALGADASRYLNRAALDETGQPLPTPLAYLRSAAGATIDWSPNGRFYLVGTISAVGAIANDPLYAGWSSTAGLSVQWRL